MLQRSAPPPRRRGTRTISILPLVLAALVARSAPACDVCAVYTATQQREARTGFQLGIGQQYTRFGTLRRDGRRVTLPVAEHIDSSITQFSVGYRPTPQFGVQLSIPLIARSYRRLHDGAIDSADQAGLGDLALVGSWNPFSMVSETSVFRFSLLGGIKFPTGDPARLGEEFVRGAAPKTVAPVRRPRHTDGGGGDGEGPGELENGGVHGHDLAFGSGSYDGLVGAQLFWSWQRAYITANVQYAIRSDGAFQYRYANDLLYWGGPGMFVLLGHDYSVGLQAVLAGETKGNDRQQGAQLDDTAVTSLYLGPGLSATWGTALSADLLIELPVQQRNTSLQILPDVRVRGGLVWRF